MVAVAQYIPKDPREKASVLLVLAEHPELQEFIAQVSDEAKRRFPEVSIEIDTVRYDEWDPLLRMLVHVTQPWKDYWDTVDGFTRSIRERPDYDRDLIFVMPKWAGPIETLTR
jgi:hypothetical protein